MGEIVEKVARAICWKNGMDPNLTLGGDGENFLWMEYESQAEAAIAVHKAALSEAGYVIVPREPTQEMFMAAINAFHEENKGIEYAPLIGWRSMIEAAE